MEKVKKKGKEKSDFTPVYHIDKGQTMKYSLLQIKNYAREHSLTAEQVQNIWEEGVMVCFKNGTIVVPSYREEELPGVLVREITKSY